MPPVRNPSPKQRFHESNDNLAKHHKLVDAPEYQRGIDYALLQFQADLAVRCGDASNAHIMGIKLSGVLEFLEVLKRLADPPYVPPEPRHRDHLPEFTKGTN